MQIAEQLKEEIEKIDKITIKPETLYMLYDGVSVLRPGVDTKLISAELEKLKGYSYRATFSGERSEVGYGTSRIESFTLIDPNGVDVTEQYEIVCEPGRLHVYLEELTIQSGSKTQEYNGTALLPDPSDYTQTGKLVSTGHRVEVQFGVSVTNAGKMANRFTVTVFDENDNDVTYMYKINKKNGTLTVTRKKLTLTAGSASKSFDGEKLTCETYEITGGELCADQVAEVRFSGAQTEIGRSDNVIISVTIFDRFCENVTNNYEIELEPGLLQVRAV